MKKPNAVLDLAVDATMLPPQVGLLWAQIRDAAERLSRSVVDLGQGELDYRGPVGGENSIGSILAHVARTNLGYAIVLGAAVPQDVERAFGPLRDEADRLPTVRHLSADDLVGRLKHSLGYIKGQVEEFSDQDLTTKIQYGPDEATVRWCLWHAAEHHVEHLGHVRTLRRQWKESRSAAVK